MTDKARDKAFKQAMIDCGIMPKGHALARVVWACADQIFDAATPAQREQPFDIADFVQRIMRSYAAMVQREYYTKKSL